MPFLSYTPDFKKTTQLRCENDATKKTAMKTVCFDLGNSRLKVSICIDGNWQDEIVFSDLASLHSFIQTEKFDQGILSSVIALDDTTRSIINDYRIHILGVSSKLNFRIGVQKKETIGPDRLALLAAASDQYLNQGVLVIALGTCITYNFLNQSGYFLGGAISPGMQMRFRALHEQTALLPQADYDWSIPMIGYDTKTNLQSGVFWGMVHELDGFIHQYQNRYPNINVVLTGGHCMHFADRLKNRIFADPHYIYKGLYALSQLNPV
jgi:type III pantothenate kinase